MVILRSGKNVPFLGKDIPKRKVSKGSQENPQKDCPKNSQQCNLTTINQENSEELSSAETSQNTSRSSVSSTDSTERSNLAVGDSSMLSASDQSTMIDDTLEITNLDDSSYMNESNQSHSRSTNAFHNYEAASKCNSNTKDAINETQSNVCGVADLSWF